MAAGNKMTKFKINGKQKKTQRKSAFSQPSQPCIQNIIIENQMCLREKTIKLHWCVLWWVSMMRTNESILSHQQLICLDMCNCLQQAYFKNTVKSVFPTKWSSLYYMAGISCFQWTIPLQSYLNTNGQYFLVSKLIMIWHMRHVMKWHYIFYYFNNVT